MGEGVARAIAIVSIILTVASLGLAVVFARKRSRIRVGFDVARAIIGVAAILVMAAVTHVTTSMTAIVVAVAVGAGLGFAQGSSLEITPGESGFYAQRSPLGIALWGVGIVVMQAAGMASRTGTVRIGQTIAWFSVCLGIGLMAGRNGPLESAKKVFAGVGLGVLAAAIVAPALIAGTATPAAADSPQLTDDEVCELIVPETSDRLAATGAYEPLPGRDFPAFAQEEDPLAPMAGSVAACRQQGYEVYTGQGWVTYTVYLFASVEDAGAQYNAEVAAIEAMYAFEWERAQEWFAVYDGQYGIGTGPLDSFDVEGRYWIVPQNRHVAMVAGPFMLYGFVSDDLAFDYGPVLPDRTHEPGRWFVETLITPMSDTAHNIEDFLAAAQPTDGDGDEDSATPPVGSIEGGSDTAARTDESERSGVAPSPPGDAAEPIEPEEAAGQAVAGLIAAAAIGAITWTEAASEIDRILGGLGSGGTPQTTTRTVVVSGAAAEAIINGGPGSSVAIPTDQQWNENVSVPGQPAVTEGRVGSVGIVRSVGPVARGPDGTVSVSVEVDAFDPSPPPPIDLDPIVGKPPEPEMVPPRPPAGEPPPLPGIDEIYEPTPDMDPLPPRPPAGEPPSLPGIDEIYEPIPDMDPLPPRVPPPDEPPPPPVDEVPPEPPPVDETPPEPPPDDEMPPDEPQGEETPAGGEPAQDEELPDDEPEDELPDGPAPAVALDPEEIEEWVRWGVERNRSPDDILQDIEGYNKARGGTGPIELPETLVQVDTPNGPVTVTATEAARYDEAAAEIARLARQRDALRGEMASLDKDAEWWGGAEQLSSERLIAGTSDMMTRINVTERRVEEINDELARLARRPDPMVWDFERAGMATREQAWESWENRHSQGWHHDQIQRLQAEQNALRSQLTEDLGEYRTTAADDTRLENIRDRLTGIEQGTRPPDMIDFGHLEDPDEEYAAALEDWRTRDTSGRYFEEAERLREEVAERESLTHVSDVEPARPGDRGTVFDRPARELARIAEEQDRTMAGYREVDRQIDAAQQTIDDIAARGSRE